MRAPAREPQHEPASEHASAPDEGPDTSSRQARADPLEHEGRAELSLRRELAWLSPWLLAVFVSLAWFVEAPAWNQNSRLALTRAMVERGSLSIDEDHPTTGDKSFKDGHFYSDKAPGVSLLAIPAHAAHVLVRRGLGLEPPRWLVRPLDPFDLLADRTPPADALDAGDTLHFGPSWRAALWVCNVASNVLMSLLAFVACFVAVRAHGGDGPRVRSRFRALLVASAALFATPSFPYATSFYGHQAAAAALFVGWAVLHVQRRVTELSARAALTQVLAGASLGLAVTCEYTTAVPVLLVCGWAALRFGLATLLRLALGGAPFAAMLATYHTVAFGHPLTTGYAFVWLPEFAEGMAVNYGLGTPRLDVLSALTFGVYRGLFTAAPVCLLAVWGLCLDALERGHGGELGSTSLARRDAALLAIAITAYALLLNAGYYMWDGGAALGPRHAVMALPFLGLGLHAALQRIPFALLAVAAISVVQMISVAAVGVELPRHGAPIWDHALPLFFDGAVTPAQDLGQWLGVPRPWSALLPLGVWWLAAWSQREE